MAAGSRLTGWKYTKTGIRMMNRSYEYERGADV